MAVCVKTMPIFWLPWVSDEDLLNKSCNGSRLGFLEYHKQLACDFGAVFLQRENRKTPQAGGLRYSKLI